MKLNWGHKLILVFIAFGCMMSYLVYRCIKTNVEMVSNDYYKDELVYQQVIDQTARANDLSEKLKIQKEGTAVVFHFPNEVKNTVVKGIAWFYCPANARKDRKIILNVNANGLQYAPEREFIPGNYIVKVNWNSSGKDYYSEQAISIQ